jgi:hypothetical protein
MIIDVAGDQQRQRDRKEVQRAHGARDQHGGHADHRPHRHVHLAHDHHQGLRHDHEPERDGLQGEVVDPAQAEDARVQGDIDGQEEGGGQEDHGYPRR